MLWLCGINSFWSLMFIAVFVSLFVYVVGCLRAVTLNHILVKL
jgi:hypothetical protein